MTPKFELSDELKPVFEKAKKLEWATVVYLLTVVVLMYLTTGNSQAMKVAWLEDMLSIVPAVSFLVAAHFAGKAPSKKFPYGYHSAFTIAFLCGSVALFAIGCFVLADSVFTLVKMEHPSIGAVTIGGHTIWLGYVMYAVLLYSSLPAVWLGQKKLPLAKALHNKVLFTDADTQKADWMTAVAAMVGITGIGIGWWWADSAAAILISLNIIYDGYSNLKCSVQDLLSRQPQQTDQKEPDPLLQEISAFIKSHSWIKDSAIRFRENGQIYFGEVFVIPDNEEHLLEQCKALTAAVKELHWKINDVCVVPVTKLPEESDRS